MQDGMKLAKFWKRQEDWRILISILLLIAFILGLQALFAAVAASPMSDELKPCPGVSTEPIPVWMCYLQTDRPVTEPTPAVQEELNQAWERFLDEASQTGSSPRP